MNLLGIRIVVFGLSQCSYFIFTAFGCVWVDPGLSSLWLGQNSFCKSHVLIIFTICRLIGMMHLFVDLIGASNLQWLIWYHHILRRSFLTNLVAMGNFRAIVDIEIRIQLRIMERDFRFAAGHGWDIINFNTNVVLSLLFCGQFLILTFQIAIQELRPWRGNSWAGLFNASFPDPCQQYDLVLKKVLVNIHDLVWNVVLCVLFEAVGQDLPVKRNEFGCIEVFVQHGPFELILVGDGEPTLAFVPLEDAVVGGVIHHSVKLTDIGLNLPIRIFTWARLLWSLEGYFAHICFIVNILL